MKKAIAYTLSLITLAAALCSCSSPSSVGTQTPVVTRPPEVVSVQLPEVTPTPSPEVVSGSNAWGTQQSSGTSSVPSSNSSYTSVTAPTYTPTPTSSPVYTPAATPVPASTQTYSTALTVTKDPTNEYVEEGGRAVFIARADNASGMSWTLTSPDFKTELRAESASASFPGLIVEGQGTEKLVLNSVPLAMNGWRVQCCFYGSSGSVYSKGAYLTVSAKQESASVVISGSGTSTGTSASTIGTTTGSSGTIVITKNPTGETVGAGQDVVFVARADNALSYEWFLVSPDGGTRISAASVSANFPGMSVDGAYTSMLILYNVSAQLNAWSAQCCFYGNGSQAYSAGAVITISAESTPVVNPGPAQAAMSYDANAIYKSIIEAYRNAAAEKLDAYILSAQNLSIIPSFVYGDDPFGNMGYLIRDFDGDGIEELAVGSTSKVSDEFCSKMIFALYTIENGEAVEVFRSFERDRYYYAGSNRFANIGSDSAFSSFETTRKLEDRMLIDMTYTTAPENYVQLDLIPFSSEAGSGYVIS